MPLSEFEHNPTGKKIRFLLLDQNKTVAELAQKMGLTRQNLYRKIRRNSWTLDDIKAIAQIFCVDPKELI